MIPRFSPARASLPAVGALLLVVIGLWVGPVTIPRGVSLWSNWALAVVAGLGSIVAVDLIRGGHTIRLAVGAIVIVVAVGAALALPGTSVPGALRVIGLADRALAPGLWIIGITVAVLTTVAVVDHLRPSLTAILAAAAGASMAITDVATISRGLDRGDALRDLKLYLTAGENLRAGLPVYETTVLSGTFTDQSLYPFLYPPPVLPVFAAFSTLPWIVIGTLWIVLSFATASASLRLLGVRWSWLPILLLWPPLFEGIWAGNVAVPGLLLLAAAVAWRSRSATLVAGPLLKLQAGIPALWLVRERLWRQLAVGLGVVALFCLATLPIVGVDEWLDWLAGLQAFQASQAAIPALYSFALPQVVPYAAFLLIAVAAVGWGLVASGLDGLRRLAIASVVASPSLYRHGLVSLLPALMILPAEVVWLVLGTTATYAGIWIAVAVTAVAATLPGYGRRTEATAGVPRRDDAVPST